jgi:hypothetical protein
MVGRSGSQSLRLPCRVLRFPRIRTCRHAAARARPPPVRGAARAAPRPAAARGAAAAVGCCRRAQTTRRRWVLAAATIEKRTSIECTAPLLPSLQACTGCFVSNVTANRCCSDTSPQVNTARSGWSCGGGGVGCGGSLATARTEVGCAAFALIQGLKPRFLAFPALQARVARPSPSSRPLLPLSSATHGVFRLCILRRAAQASAGDSEGGASLASGRAAHAPGLPRTSPPALGAFAPRGFLGWTHGQVRSVKPPQERALGADVQGRCTRTYCADRDNAWAAPHSHAARRPPPHTPPR